MQSPDNSFACLLPTLPATYTLSRVPVESHFPIEVDRVESSRLRSECPIYTQHPAIRRCCNQSGNGAGERAAVLDCLPGPELQKRNIRILLTVLQSASPRPNCYQLPSHPLQSVHLAYTCIAAQRRSHYAAGFDIVIHALP